MFRARPVLVQPLLMALLGLAFCVWSAFGNDINFCVTAGCTLYQDTTVGGISMWWFGAGAFGLLGTFALAGAVGLGRFCSALALLGDICLLALLAATAPCLLCLIAAIFFALTYRAFRRSVQPQAGLGRPAGNIAPSILLVVWTLLFIVNAGSVVRSQNDVWPLLDDETDAAVHLYFSPSCPSCREAVEALSGRVDVAFYPLAEGEIDVHKTQAMENLLGKGMSMAEALADVQNVAVPEGLWDKIRPELWFLRLRLLRNKAHVFGAGSSKVPFVEFRGLPASLVKQATPRNDRPEASSRPQSVPALPEAPSGTPLDDKLPVELAPLTSGHCSGNRPCN